MAKSIDVFLRLRALDKISTPLQRVEKRFPRLAQKIQQVNRAFRRTAVLTANIRKNLDRFGTGARNAGRNLTTNLSLPVGLAGAAVIKTALDFEKSMNKVGALTGTITKKGGVTDNFRKLEDQAKELGRTTEFSASQVGDAMVFLARAGFVVNDTKNEIGDAIPEVLALASATGVEIPMAADVAAKTLRAFGLQAKEAGRVADVMAVAAASSNVDLESLSETMKFTAPIAKAYGASLEETVAVTGLLGDVGIQGSVAGTALKNIFLKLATPSSKATKMLKALNVSVTDGKGGMKGLDQIIGELAPKLAKLPKDAQLGVLNELFGLRGIAGAAALMENSLASAENPMAAFAKRLEKSSGKAAEMRDIMQRGAVGAFNRFISALEGAAIAFAKSGILDAFASILDKLGGMFTAMSELNPTVLKFISIIAALAAILGPALTAIGFMSIGIAKLVFLLPILKGLLIGIGAVFAFLTSPIGLVVAAIALVVGGFVLAFKKIKPFRDFVMGLVDAVGGLGDKLLFLLGPLGAVSFLGKKAFEFFSGAGGAPTGAKAGAEDLAQKKAESTQLTNNAKVGVDFTNVPRGTEIREKPGGTAPLDLGVAFSGGV